MTTPTTYIAHHPDCDWEYAPHAYCSCGGREKPFYPRRECVRCGRVVKLCRCKEQEPHTP
jgi:hypothetical protein